MARPPPEEPSNWFVQATCTRKRLPIMQRVNLSGLQTPPPAPGCRNCCSFWKLVAKAPSTLNCSGLQSSLLPQPPKSWATTSPFASMAADPELPPKVPPFTWSE